MIKIYAQLKVILESGMTLEPMGSFGLAVCFGGGGGGGSPQPAAYKRSREEKELDSMQLSDLKRQRKYQEEMEPFELESMGLMRDQATGKIVKNNIKTPQQLLLEKNMRLQGMAPDGTKLTESQIMEGMTESEKMDYGLNRATKQRQLDALGGKLPISPALEAELKDQETQAGEVLNRKLGADWMLSTPGQELMKKMQQKNELVREEARRGDITGLAGITAAQNAGELNKMQSTSQTASEFSGLSANKLNQMMGLTGAQTMSYDVSSDMSSKYASRGANQQNLAMQRYQTDANTRNSNVQAGASVAAAAAAK